MINPRCLVLGAGLMVAVMALGLILGLVVVWWRNRPSGPPGGVSG